MPDDSKEPTQTPPADPPEKNDESDWQRFSNLIDERVGAAVKRELGPSIKDALKEWQPSGTSGEGAKSDPPVDPPKPDPQKRSSQPPRRGFLEKAMGWRPPEITSQ